MELDDTMRSKETLEKASYAMMEELRALKAKMENQASDFTTIALDLRSKSRRLEEDAKVVVSPKFLKSFCLFQMFFIDCFFFHVMS